MRTESWVREEVYGPRTCHVEVFEENTMLTIPPPDTVLVSYPLLVEMLGQLGFLRDNVRRHEDGS